MKKSQLKQLIRECVDEVLNNQKSSMNSNVKNIYLGTNFMWEEKSNEIYKHCTAIHKNDIQVNRPFGANRGMEDYTCSCSCPEVEWNLKNPYKKSTIKWTIDSTD